MFRTKKEKNGKGKDSDSKFLGRKSPPTIVSFGVDFFGNIVSSGVLDIDGNIEGNVRCRSLTVRKNGLIRGDIIAEEVHNYGEIYGVVRAKDVHLYDGGSVHGTIIHENLTIEDGASVDGQFKKQTEVILDEDVEDEHIDILSQFNLIEDNTVSN